MDVRVVKALWTALGSPERAGARRWRRGSMAMSPAAQRGVSTVEFSVVAMLVLLPLLTAVLELAQLAVSRHILGYAATEVARLLETMEPASGEGSSSAAGVLAPATAASAATSMAATSMAATTSALTAASADELRLRRVVGIAMLPLYSQGESLDGGTSASTAVLGRAFVDTLRPDQLRIGLETLPAASSASARWVSVQRVTLRYCRELYFAPISDVLPAVLRTTTVDPFDQWCLTRSRMPISASAVLVRPRLVVAAQSREGGSVN